MNEHTGRWVGIDISKSKLDVPLLDPQGKVKSHVFANDAKGHAALGNWLIDRGCQQTDTRLCMEATGPYSEAPAIALSDAGWQVSVVNPARVKGFALGELLRNKGRPRRCGLARQIRPGNAAREVECSYIGGATSAWSGGSIAKPQGDASSSKRLVYG